MIFARLHLEYNSSSFSVLPCSASEIVSPHPVTMISSAIANTPSMSPITIDLVGFFQKILLKIFNPNDSLDHLYRPHVLIVVANMLDRSSSLTCQYASLMANLLNSLAFRSLGSISSRVGNLQYLRNNAEFKACRSIQVVRFPFALWTTAL